jgi:hypothetical protein
MAKKIIQMAKKIIHGFRAFFFTAVVPIVAFQPIPLIGRVGLVRHRRGRETW